MWSKLVEELEPIGFVLATVHSEHERELARKVGVRELPHLVLLTDGKVSNSNFPEIEHAFLSVPFKPRASIFTKKKNFMQEVETNECTGITE
jgi:thioredoxin-like negative regulator of GroEL